MSLVSRLRNFVYNLDRAVASLFGASPQETISSQAGRIAGRNEIAKILCDALNKVDPGHCEHAVRHANALDAADDHVEK